MTDSFESQVEISKALVLIEYISEVVHIGVGGDGDGATDFDHGHSHEAEVAVEGEVAVGGDELAELFATLQECSESKT